MSIEFIYIYFPKELTNKAWQKAKSVADKASKKTKTGLGEALEAAEKQWAKINWDSMIADNAMGPVDQSAKYRGEKEFDFAKAVGEAELKNGVAVLRKLMIKAAGVARDTSKNPDLSKGAVKKAQEISKGLLDYEAMMRDISLDDFDKKKEHFLKLFAMQMKNLLRDINTLEGALKDNLKTPTLEFFLDNCKQRFRSVGNTLGNFQQFKEEWKVWQPWDGLHAERHKVLANKKNLGTEAEGKTIKEICNAALSEIPKLKQKAGQFV